MPRTRQTVDEQRVELAKEEREALQLKIGGASYARIAQHQGIATSSAYARVKRALAEITLAPAMELKVMETERLEALVAALWPIAMKQGDRQVEAVRELRRLSESLRKLHGIDAPARRSIEVFTHDNFSELVGRLEAQLGENDPEGAVVGA